MSTVIGDHVVVVPTTLGGMTVRTRYVTGLDVEDIVRAKAESQAILVQLINVGKDTIAKSPNAKILTSAFTEVTEELEDV